MHVKLNKFFNRILFQASSPQKLALMVALGLMVGILPLVWGGTLVCMLFACLFRLNQAGIQAANYLAYPLQIALIVPFYRLGAKIFPWNPAVSKEAVLNSIGSGIGADIMQVAVATLKAVGVWLIVAPPTACLLYLCLLPAFKRLLDRRNAAAGDAGSSGNDQPLQEN